MFDFHVAARKYVNMTEEDPIVNWIKMINNKKLVVTSDKISRFKSASLIRTLKGIDSKYFYLLGQGDINISTLFVRD